MEGDDEPMEYLVGSIDQMREFLASNTVIEVRPERAFGLIERPEDFSLRATRWNWS